MRRWEYRYEEWPAQFTNLAEQLNVLGLEGWELVSVSTEFGGNAKPRVWHAVLKRPIESPAG